MSHFMLICAVHEQLQILCSQKTCKRRHRISPFPAQVHVTRKILKYEDLQYMFPVEILEIESFMLIINLEREVESSL